jgi:hypothetical protein
MCGCCVPACVQDSAEFGRIGRYYAAESMLVWDDKRQVELNISVPLQCGLTPCLVVQCMSP